MAKKKIVVTEADQKPVVPQKTKLELLTERKQILADAKVNLKKKFFGIDAIIDKFIASVESWYLFPELRTKPLVVNLWGITGVGKTGLVREFVRLVGMEQDYCEITQSESDFFSMSNVLDESGITFDSKAVVLIDEFQHLRTKNEKSEEVEPDELVDLWTFLSDGSFPVPYNMKQRISNCIDEMDEGYESNKKNKVGTYMATKVFNLMNMTGNALPIEQVKGIKVDECIRLLNKVKDKVDTYSNKVYSKLLVIISGNLDEAFNFADEVDDADTDADIMNEISDDIKITNIKKALLVRFRPEQIARLGNIHLIYPVLNRDAYNKIISAHCDGIVSRYKTELGIDVTVDESIKTAIYKNGVFPSQGVRPVFSTISAILENPLSNLACYAYENGIKSFRVVFEDGLVKASDIVGFDEAEAMSHMTVKVEAVLEDIRNKTTKNETIHTAVHEAGHAILEAMLFGVAPRQVTAKTSMNGAAGFTTTHANKSTTRDYLLKDIEVMLGGRAAEEIVFGSSNVSAGICDDIERATSLAMKINNEWALGPNLSKWDGQVCLDMSADRQNECADIIDREYKKAVSLIERHKDFLIAVTDALTEQEKLTGPEMVEIAARFGVKCKVYKEKDAVEESFDTLWDKFKSKAKRECKWLNTVLSVLS